MRNLTIKRNKTFVGCAGKLRVYIEDAASSETVINGVGCRKLGDIKNGEEKTFAIAEDAAKVFVIADQLSKGFCNEYYQLPEGQEDIALSGQCKLNPAAGNAFRFDNNNSAEVLANRKKSTGKGVVVLIIALIFGMVCGFALTSGLFSLGVVKDKTFTSEGMAVTLTTEFQKTKMQNYTVAYKTRDVMVVALKENFELVDGFENYTLDQYLDAVLQANKLNDSAAVKADGLVGFVYNATDPATKQEYRYYNYVYKADDAFWLVQFVVLSQNAEQYEKDIVKWAKSVDFAD